MYHGGHFRMIQLWVIDIFLLGPSCHFRIFCTEHGCYYQKRKTKRITTSEFFKELPRGQDSEPWEAASGQYHRTSHHLRVCLLMRFLEPALNTMQWSARVRVSAFLLSFFIILSVGNQWLPQARHSPSLAPLVSGLHGQASPLCLTEQTWQESCCLISLEDSGASRPACPSLRSFDEVPAAFQPLTQSLL